MNFKTFDINSNQIEDLLDNSDPESFCAILPVHLMGYPADMDNINRIAKKYDLVVFEDAAQAHGSKYKGRNTGTLSLIADYSFYIAHNIQVGEMGAVVTCDEKLNKLIKKIKANGRTCDCSICTRSKGYCPKNHLKQDPRFLHDMIGYNFKTMEFQAALGLVQLNSFDDIIKKRQQNVEYLNRNLSKYSKDFQFPVYSDDVSYLAYPIVINKDSKINREKFRESIASLGVESRPLFGSIPTQQPAYSEYYEYYKDKLTNADYLGNNAFYIRMPSISRKK